MKSTTMVMEPMVQPGGHTQEWHDARRKGIGGSDSPIILLGDKHPFSTPLELWRDKMGLNPPKPVTPVMERGSRLEPIIAQIYAEQTGRKVVSEPLQLKHPDYPFMLGNIDSWVEAERGRGIGEFKAPNMKTYLKCKHNGPLDYYMIQLQHYLGVSSTDFGSFGIFSAELWELCTFDVDKDDEFFGIILDACQTFWRRVENGTPPEVAASQQKELKLPTVDVNTEIVKITSEGWADAVHTYRVARELREEAEEIEKSSQQRLINLMEVNKAEVAEGAGLRVYYREQAGRKTFDHKAFAAAHPDMKLDPWYKTGANIRAFRPYFID